MPSAVYILASKRNGTLYIGVTSDLVRRVTQHKNKEADGFTKKYGIDILVWYQTFDSITDAITAEKRLKEWKRSWKVQLIERDNPYWNDLSDKI